MNFPSVSISYIYIHTYIYIYKLRISYAKYVTSKLFTILYMILRACCLYTYSVQNDKLFLILDIDVQLVNNVDKVEYVKWRSLTNFREFCVPWRINCIQIKQICVIYRKLQKLMEFYLNRVFDPLKMCDSLHFTVHAITDNFIGLLTIFSIKMSNCS